MTNSIFAVEQKNLVTSFDILLTVHLSIFISVITNLMHKIFVLQ